MQADRELIFLFEFQIFTSPNSSHSIFCVYFSRPILFGLLVYLSLVFEYNNVFDKNGCPHIKWQTGTNQNVYQSLISLDGKKDIKETRIKQIW